MSWGFHSGSDVYSDSIAGIPDNLLLVMLRTQIRSGDCRRLLGSKWAHKTASADSVDNVNYGTRILPGSFDIPSEMTAHRMSHGFPLCRRHSCWRDLDVFMGICKIHRCHRDYS